jgi:hypothetical protein
MGTARVITTAPTNTQVRGILWVEINQLHANYDLPGRVNQTEWWMGSYLAGIGRKPADYNPAAFQGLHARYPLIIVDEASGVPRTIMDAIETLATNVNAKILMIGNPDDPTSLFAEIHADPDKFSYHTIKISAWDTPNFTDEPVTDLLKEVLLSKQWVEQRRKAWGIDHPFWLSKVEAEFPSIDTNSIIKIHDVIAARVPFAERPETPSDIGATDTLSHADQGSWDEPMSVVCGVDVAGSEDGDETVVRLIHTSPQTSAVKPMTEWRIRTADPELLANFIVNCITLAKTSAPMRVIIDSIGVGFGIIGSVRAHPQLPKGVAVEGFNGAQSPEDKEQYGNARAELWWGARLLFQNGKIDTSNADNLEQLEAQLVEPRYKIVKGKIYVESKDEINKRLGRSPDNADAFMYALYSTLSSGIIKIAPPPMQPVAQQNQTHFTQRTSQASRAARLPMRRSA